MSTSRFLVSFTACLALSAVVSAGDEPTLEQRLEKLAESLETAREEAHIPGMSIAIVKDDEIVWARGFGLADVAADKPADENTIYAIGSTTKAFTASLIGMLADDGLVNWDDPVTDYLPYFDLQVQSDDENAECTLRDLLSHRHGFARMSLLWFGGKLTREEMLRTAANAEPWDDFRAAFHYCNVTYLAAGVAAGVADESSWDELMVNRIFEPLGMTSSTLSTADAREDPRLALGYKWDEVDEEYEHLKMVELAMIGPAGSVNSNVLDMAQWLRMQLGEGQVDEMQLISTERILETWTPQIEIGNGAYYGLGWMLREYDGRKVVEHGGNIDGFSAQIGLIPEESLGYVLLMNRDVSPLQQSSLRLVFDALLAEWPEEGAEQQGDDVDFDDYLGTYLANFASFRDEEFEILIHGDRLALDIPSQQTYDLEQPDEDDKWYFALTDQIAVSFQRNSDGRVNGLTLHQSGFSFEVPRVGIAIEPEVPIEELEKYVGTFVRADGGKRIKIFIDQGRLTMDDKGKHLVFHTPDATGHAALRARADYGATFKTGAEGTIDSLVFNGSSGAKLFTRLADELDVDLPTLDEVFALRQVDARVAAMQAAGGTKSTGTVWVAQAGLRGKLTIFSEGTDRFASHMDFGKVGRIDVVSKAGEAWRYNSMRGLEEIKGEELAQALLEHPGAVEGDWAEYFDSITVVRNDTLNERPIYVVKLENEDSPSRTYWIDADNGDVLRVKMIAIERSIHIPFTIDYSEFEELGGIRYPMRVKLENPASGRMVMTIESVESGLEFGDEVFTLEDPDAH